jgi:hypothetical protein
LVTRPGHPACISTSPPAPGSSPQRCSAACGRHGCRASGWSARTVRGSDSRIVSPLAVYLDEYPTWRADGWFPIAGDGTGNYYVLLTKGPQAGFIGFIEAVVDPDRLDYLVASNLWSFLRFLFRRDLGARGWPFDRATVLADDPHLADAPAKLQPWNT